MVNEQEVRNCESGVRNCPVIRVIDVLDLQLCDSCIMRLSWQVYKYLSLLR